MKQKYRDKRRTVPGRLPAELMVRLALNDSPHSWECILEHCETGLRLIEDCRGRLSRHYTDSQCDRFERQFRLWAHRARVELSKAPLPSPPLVQTLVRAIDALIIQYGCASEVLPAYFQAQRALEQARGR